MAKFEKRQFQTLVENHILAGDDVILQAPTGAGKTKATMRPALKGFEAEDVSRYPQRLVHAVPMRVLARSFLDEYTKIAKDNSKWHHNNWYPTIQTGETAEDALFENRLVFATVDQVLASFLNIPYGIPKRLDNINAGAFIGSYLVFDEFHLYPTQEMLLTVLAMLKMLKGITRFTLMSATFSPALLQAIATELGAVPIYAKPDTPLAKSIFSDISTLKKQKRRWRACEGILDGSVIEQALQEHRTVLVICNQVERAQAVYQQFKAKNETIDCKLLHSRFYANDRRNIENDILQWLSQDANDGRKKVIIATQVVEVGLDISAEILLTECAPAASLIQRAGRCARWGGDGDVWVYQPPQHPDMDKPNYAPYIDDGFETICQLTWEKLSSTAFHDKVLPYHMEQQLVRAAHEAHDKDYLIDGLSSKLDTRIDRITQCMQERDEGFVSDLIRQQDNSSARVYIMGHRNDERITHNLHTLEALNVSKGLLKRAFEYADEEGAEADFLFASGEALEEDYEENEQVRTRTVHRWHILKQANDSYKHRLLLAHPTILGYTSELGVHINHDFVQTPSSPEKPKQDRRKSYSYYADTYAQHIEGLYLAYTRIGDFPISGKRIFYQPLYTELKFAVGGLLKRMKRSETWDEVTYYLRLMLALHDVGKLNQQWQDWALARHRFFVERLGDTGIAPTDGTPLAHTAKGSAHFIDKTQEDAFEATFKQHYRKSRGNHSVESAEAISDLIAKLTAGDKLWQSVILAAICHHHTPSADEIRDTFQMVANGQDAIEEALFQCGFSLEEIAGWDKLIKGKFTRRKSKVRKAIDYSQPRYSGYDIALMYFLFVRVLRLADQRSSIYIHQGDYGTS